MQKYNLTEHTVRFSHYCQVDHKFSQSQLRIGQACNVMRETVVSDFRVYVGYVCGNLYLF